MKSDPSFCSTLKRNNCRRGAFGGLHPVRGYGFKLGLWRKHPLPRTGLRRRARFPPWSSRCGWRNSTSSSGPRCGVGTILDDAALRECEATARDLAERENSCCSFFHFDFDAAADGLMMRIGVLEDHVDVLDALQARISTAASASSGGSRQ